jgi:hypothetical protein
MLRTVILLVSFLAFGEGLHAQVSLPIQAKGMWIWKLWSAAGGNLTAVIEKLKSVGATWVVAKMGDSDSYYNSTGRSLYSWASTYGGMDSVVSSFHRNGIKILGYQYVYGAAQYGLGLSEADVANMILSVNGIDGLLVDAEIQYDTLPDRVSAAQSYMDTIRAHHPNSFVGLTSWARVVVHATFPWVTFLSRVDVNMPQAYWAARPVTPATELSRMSSEFTTYTQIWVIEGDTAAAKPIEPIGQAEYFGYGNDVRPGDISSFCSLSQATYGYQGVSLWEYAQITSSFVWDEYTSAWPLTSVSDGNGATIEYGLSQNYPNPFNPSSDIRYQISEFRNVRLVVYDLLGREVTVLVDEEKGPGSYEVTFDAATLASGVYFYRLQSGDFVQTRKLLLLR